METTTESDQTPLELPITKCMMGNWEVTISNNHRFSWKKKTKLACISILKWSLF